VGFTGLINSKVGHRRPPCSRWTTSSDISTSSSPIASSQRQFVLPRRREPCHQKRSNKVALQLGVILCQQYGAMPLSSEIRADLTFCREARSSLNLRLWTTLAGQSDFGRRRRTVSKCIVYAGKRAETNEKILARREINARLRHRTLWQPSNLEGDPQALTVTGWSQIAVAEVRQWRRGYLYLCGSSRSLCDWAVGVICLEAHPTHNRRLLFFWSRPSLHNATKTGVEETTCASFQAIKWKAGVLHRYPRRRSIDLSLSSSSRWSASDCDTE
jgi:hypothetical protein